jgi:hypothetical protein
MSGRPDPAPSISEHQEVEGTPSGQFAFRPADPSGGRRALATIAGGDTGPEGSWLWTQPAFAAQASDLSQQALIFVVVRLLR